MSRLIVFGCSLAYGVGLPDCWPDTTAPSKFCWPKLIADSMNRTLVNKSTPGASNKLIWHAINNFKFETDDIVVISWTYPNRYSILKTPWRHHDLHHNLVDLDPASSAYYTELHSFYDSFSMSRLYVDHANRICKDKNLPVYHLVVDKHYLYIMGKIKNVPLYLAIYEDSYPRALDNDHLGIEGHRAFAADFMNYVGIKHSLENIQKPYSLLKQLPNTLSEIFKQLKNFLCKLI
jgi:hypothetical protein